MDKPSVSTDDVESRKRKATALKRIITRFNTYVKKLYDQTEEITSLQREILSAKVSEIQSAYNEYVNVQAQLSEDEDSSEQQQENHYESTYYEALGMARMLQKNASALDSREGEVDPDAHNHSYTKNDNQGSALRACSYRLPAIKLPTFDGNHDQWLSFKDQYTALIHNRKDYPLIQKFLFLNGCLEKEAKALIGTVGVTSDNYGLAWKMLCNRYDNRNGLIDRHIEAILSAPTVKNETAYAIHSLVETVTRNMHALEMLGEPIPQNSAVILYVIRSKLDKQSRREWELAGVEDVTIGVLLDHLQRKAAYLERYEPTGSAAGNNQYKPSTPPAGKYQPPSKNIPPQRGPHYQHQNHQNPARQVYAVGAYSNPKCTFCSEQHRSYQCPKYVDADSDGKQALVKEFRACQNCLNGNHTATNCYSKHRCFTCKGKHHTTLHRKQQPDQQKANQSLNMNVSNFDIKLAENTNSTTSLLPTVVVTITTEKGNSMVARALLDTGSQGHLLTLNCKKKLHLQTTPANVTITGVGGYTSKGTERATIQISSRVSSYARTICCMVVDKITSTMPAVTLNTKSIVLPNGVKLADNGFHSPGEIDLLLGSDVVWECLLNHSIKLHKTTASLKETTFGWIAVGRLPPAHNVTQCHVAQYERVPEPELERFWTIEEVPKPRATVSQEEAFCEEYFNKTTTRDKTGRFVVRLPRQPAFNLLNNNSYAISQKRFSGIERKLNRNTELRKLYVEFLDEYETLQHMSLTQHDAENKSQFYLPHHDIVKEERITTKLRVVFDASCQLANGKSLNDSLCRGPVLQADILTQLLKFRRHRYVATADVTKMYRQIWVHEEDKRLQCIVWRKSSNATLQTYQLNTITYGTKPASYLATKCLQIIGDNCGDRQVKEVIQNDFYMDDLLTGDNDQQLLSSICKAVHDELLKYGLPLRKWRSNTDLGLPTAEGELHLVDKETTKALGLVWNPAEDALIHACFSKDTTKTAVLTKRTALSTIGSIYDPLGLLAPVIVRAKLFMRHLWTRKLDWDQQIADEDADTFNSLITELSELKGRSIPRMISMSATFELHIFTDASESAYGATVHARSKYNDQYCVRLLCSKTKVAPLKSLTIARLELCGALLGVTLAAAVATALNLDIKLNTFWTDSTIVLAWLKKMPYQLKTFISNRVAQIQEYTDISQWKYVNTKLNPADLCTRGVSADHLSHSTLWWNGPSWLSTDESKWPAEQTTQDEQLPELRTLTVTTHQPILDFDRFSSYARLLNVMFYIRKWLCYKRNQNFATTTDVFNQYRKARNALLRLAQLDMYADDIQVLQRGKTLPPSSPLFRLLPLLDKAGLVRITGRLENSDCPYDEKHPIILSSKHRLAQLFMEHLHRILLHGGPQLIINESRRTVWIPQPKILARRVCWTCTTCFHNKPRNQQPVMGNLPSVRTVPAPPFSSVGVDFAGPIAVTSSHLRGSKTYKAYVSVFVCMVTRAVHLELVTDLSTNAFLAAFRRFTSRRGVPTRVYSDNGTNFVGASKELKQCASEEIVSDRLVLNAALQQCEWHFIPPSSPNFGGLWEAAVKSMKHHLRRTLGDNKMTYEETNTLLCQIECVLNSRPLCPLSDDPSDHSILSPAHFLIGRPMLATPELVNDDSSCLRIRYRRVQSYLRQFWVQWRASFLRSLQHRTKWHKKSDVELAVGDPVLVEQANVPPAQWTMGRVIEIHPGTDGHVRVASVLLPNRSKAKRSVSKLYRLPIKVD